MKSSENPNSTSRHAKLTLNWKFTKTNLVSNWKLLALYELIKFAQSARRSVCTDQLYCVLCSGVNCPDIWDVPFHPWLGHWWSQFLTNFAQGVGSNMYLECEYLNEKEKEYEPFTQTVFWLDEAKLVLTLGVKHW